LIHAEERVTPKNRRKIEWKLIKDLPVSSTDAIEKLEWYALRWKIEVFHKILTSGCKDEESKLRTAQRLTNLISLSCILSWRVFWMAMLNRSARDAVDFNLDDPVIRLGLAARRFALSVSSRRRHHGIHHCRHRPDFVRFGMTACCFAQLTSPAKQLLR